MYILPCMVDTIHEVLLCSVNVCGDFTLCAALQSLFANQSHLHKLSRSVPYVDLMTISH